MKKYIIALDQGTTSSRAMLIDRAGCPVASVQRPVPKIDAQHGGGGGAPRGGIESRRGA